MKRFMGPRTSCARLGSTRQVHLRSRHDLWREFFPCELLNLESSYGSSRTSKWINGSD